MGYTRRGEEPGVPDQPIERKLAAIFAADIAGYSRLMACDEIGTLTRLKACRSVVDGLIAAHRGRIFNTAGDSVVADFASPVDAVQCAVAVQTAIAAEETGGDGAEPMRLSIGIHVGDVIVDGANLLGDGVNIAARLEALAVPGAICVSAAARDHIGNKLPLDFDDLGEQQVKNIARPIRVFGVGARASRPPAPTLPSHASGGGLGREAAGTAAVQPMSEAVALPLPDKPSIAVLPFQNLSGDPEQEYFADGMVEDITTALSKIRWFFVIARNSSFTYKGRAVDVKQVGRELGVRYVLEGSVRRGGNRLRITAQLVDATTGNHVWAERYDRDLADIFAVQDEITERVVAAIEPELYAAEHIRSQREPPESLDAWECVIRALAAIARGTREANTEAERLSRRATAIAPSYGQAHSLLAWVHLRNPVVLRTVLPEALTEARAALSLDERDPWAHLTHGIALWRMRRHAEAEQAFRRALELNPNFALAHAFLGSPLSARGAHEEAVKSAEHALRLSPGDRLVAGYASFAMGFAHFSAARYSDATIWAHKILERQPESVVAHCLLIAAEGMQGHTEAATEALGTLFRLRPDFSLAWADETVPLAGEILQRLLDGLRRAGAPGA